jgi:flagellar biosynthesis component FlhA
MPSDQQVGRRGEADPAAAAPRGASVHRPVALALEGIQTHELAFELPAIWITQDKRDRAIAAGYTVVDPTTAISTHLSEIIWTFLPDLLTRRQTKI